MAFERQLAALAAKKGRAGQRHRGGAEAALAGAALGAAGSVRGPFWPQAASSHPLNSQALSSRPAPARKGVKRGRATLDFDLSRMQGIL